jgi:hypothetical protein
VDLLQHVEKSENLEAIVADFQYQGFDPLKMHQIIKQIAELEKKKGTLQSDVTAMVSLSVSRGTNVEKVAKKMGEVGKTKVDMLIARYGLIKSSKGAGPDSISLSRVVATYPQVAAMIIAKTPSSNSRLAALEPSLPPYLAFPGANALIPRTGEKASFHAAYESFAEAFSKLVGSTQTEGERENFIKITRDSPITGADAQRAQLLNVLAETYRRGQSGGSV